MLLSNNIETKAMLVHHNRTTSMVSVTSHDVLALDEGRAFTLGAGRAFSAYDKADLANLLLDEDSSIDFLPENRLVSSRTMLIWYRLPETRDIRFANRTIKTPMPGLIFIAAANWPLRCFAFKGRKRPTLDTPLYYPPLGNVYRDGNFCTGNVNLPREVRAEHIPTWENFVLESTNTHSGSVKPVRGCTTVDDLANFLAGLEESKAKTFPAGKLAPCTENGEPKTLSHVLKGGEACKGLR